MRGLSQLLFALLLTSSGASQSAGLTLSDPRREPYTFSSQEEAAYLGSGAGLLLWGLSVESTNSDPSEEELGRLDRRQLPGYDRPYAGLWNRKAQHESDILLLTSIALPLGLIAKRRQAGLGLLYLEVMSLNVGGFVLAKALVARYRPYAYKPDVALHARLAGDAKNSFFSGHAASIAAGLVFSAKIYCDENPLTPLTSSLVWGSALATAAYGGWARVRGGMHFPSDVLVGLGWGAGLGLAVPWAHQVLPLGPQVALSPLLSQQGTGVMLTLQL